MPEKSLVAATMHLPSSVVILSASAGGQHGAMTATAMFVSQVPPLLAVSVSKTFSTYQLVEKAKEFAVNVISDTQLELAKTFGSVHGQEVDKLQESGVSTESATTIGAPLIAGCYANIECRVKSSLWDVEGNHAVYIAEIVGFKVNGNLSPTIWLNNRYFKVGGECRM